MKEINWSLLLHPVIEVNGGNDPADAGFSGMLTFSNLNPDELDALALLFA